MGLVGRRRRSALSILGCATLAQGFQIFVAEIPNGAQYVALGHPGLGHVNPTGGGPNNQFGLDFFVKNTTTGRSVGRWTQILCQTDSDGDGQSNGQEMGDPCCIFTKGGVPARTALVDLSDPSLATSITSAPTCPSGTDSPAGPSATGVTLYYQCQGGACYALSKEDVQNGSPGRQVTADKCGGCLLAAASPSPTWAAFVTPDPAASPKPSTPTAVPLPLGAAAKSSGTGCTRARVSVAAIVLSAAGLSLSVGSESASRAWGLLR